MLQARHSVGLSEFLRNVSGGAKDAREGAIIDDVQREPDLERLLGDTPRRIILGLDTEDATDLEVDPIAGIKSLRRRGVIEAALESLPELDDDAIASQVLQRFPATHEQVATAFARRLEGRIALVDQALQVPEVRLRARGDQLCMVPEQVARLSLAVEDLLDERWRTLGRAERRLVLVLARCGFTPFEQLRRLCGALHIDADAALELAKGWVEIRGDVVLPTKGARRLLTRLIERNAPVALEVEQAVRDVVGQAASEPRELATKSPPRQAPRSGKGQSQRNKLGSGGRGSLLSARQPTNSRANRRAPNANHPHPHRSDVAARLATSNRNSSASVARRELVLRRHRTCRGNSSSL